MHTAETGAVHRLIDRIWRQEAGRILAHLTRLVGDMSAAEDLAQDALLAALEQWPKSGVPDNPGAWLIESPSSMSISTTRYATICFASSSFAVTRFSLRKCG